MKKKQTFNRTYIGGQAVMEGIMMRGKRSMATAVRDPQGMVQIESERLTPPEEKKKITRVPFVRGVCNFITSLVDGNRVLMRSADVAAIDDDEQTKAEHWLEEKHKISLDGLLSTFAIILGVVLAMLIFIWLPQYISGFLPKDIFDKTDTGLKGLYFNLVEGGIRIVIFILYSLPSVYETHDKK